MAIADLLIRKAQNRIQAEERMMFAILLHVPLGAACIGFDSLLGLRPYVTIAVWALAWMAATALLRGRSHEQRLLLCWWFAWLGGFLDLALLAAAAIGCLAGLEVTGVAVLGVVGLVASLVGVAMTQLYHRLARLEAA